MDIVNRTLAYNNRDINFGVEVMNFVDRLRYN